MNNAMLNTQQEAFMANRTVDAGKEQHSRFIQKAEEPGCDEDENRFSATLRTIAKTEPQKKHGKSATSPA